MMSIRTAKKEQFIPLPLNEILNGDCLTLLQTLPSASVDCIFADPPYNLQLQGELRRPDESSVAGVNDDWDKFSDFTAYDEFSKAWLAECRRILKKDGTIWVIGAYHNIFRVGALLQDLDYWILNDIVWRKSNPMPNFRGRRFTNAHETLIWASRSKNSRYRFNYQAMKALNDDLQMRSDWYFSLCTGKERLKNEHGLKLHPTQKPEALLHRVILSCTDKEDVILDPFSGTGTTAACAKRLGRHFIGIERHPDYFKASLERLAEVEPVSEESISHTLNRREVPRVPFGRLVENGLVPPGTGLYDKHKKKKARVLADGSLICENFRGSIHKVAASVQNMASCNGWTYWHLEHEGQFVPLDNLRQLNLDL